MSAFEIALTVVGCFLVWAGVGCLVCWFSYRRGWNLGDGKAGALAEIGRRDTAIGLGFFWPLALPFLTVLSPIFLAFLIFERMLPKEKPDA